MEIRRNRRRLWIFLLGIFFLLAMVLQLGERWYYGRKDIADDMHSLAQIIGANASAALLFNDQAAGEELLAALEHSPNLMEARLFRADGTLLAAFHKSTAPAATPFADARLTPHTEYSLTDVHLAVPVVLHGDKVGTVAIRANLDELYETLIRFLAGYIVIMFIAGLLAFLATRRLRRRLSETENWLDSFFNSAQVGMAMVDRDMRYLRVNNALAKSGELPASAYVGRPIGELLPQVSHFIAPCHKAVLTYGSKFENEISGHAADDADDCHYWLTSYFPIINAQGQISASGSILLDITDRKRAELARQESELRLHSVTDHLPIAIFQLKRLEAGRLRFTYISDGALSLLGRPPEEIVTRDGLLIDAIHDHDVEALTSQLCTKHLAPDVVNQIAWVGRYAHPQMGEIWIEIRGSCLPNDTDEIIVNGVIQDVSTLKRYQREAEESRTHLQQLIKYRENVVDTVHKNIAIEIHDQLGQILTAALLHLRLLERALPEGDATVRDLVKDIDGLVNEAYRSMKDIALSLRPAVLNFGFVAAAEWLAERILDKAGIAWQVVAPSPLPELDEFQSISFFRIIQESLTNCVRHAAAQHVTIRLAVAHDQLELEILDDGHGLNGSDSQKKPGFGLLGIRERAAALGGSASISSVTAGGTCVKVVVPARNQSNSL